MLSTRLYPVVLGLLVAAPGPSARGEDWPHWLGPNRDGVSTETEWVDKGVGELWSKNVGIGYSSVSVAGGRAYTQGHDEDTSLDTIWCFEARTGEERWSHSFPSRVWDRSHGGGTLVTPSIDSDRLYTCNREGKFLCLLVADGGVIWSKDLHGEHELDHPSWGFASAPVVHENVVYVNMGVVMAFDKTTGERLWASADLGDAYATPALFALGDTPSLAVFNGRGLSVLDREDGSRRFTHDWETRFDVNAATPVMIGDGRCFISSGYNHGCSMVKVSAEGAEVLWESKVMRNHMAGCTLVGEHLYGFDESTLKCIDLNGEEKWRKRGLGKGAHLVAGDKLIVLSADGHLIVVQASAGDYRELSNEKVLDGGRYWTPPTLAQGLIYCRNSDGDLSCRDHRTPEARRASDH